MNRVEYARAERDGEVAFVTLDRPPVNAVSFEWMVDVTAAFRTPEVATANVVLLRSAIERVFCAGADLKESLDDEGHRVRAAAWREMLETVRTMPIPVIAAVSGACIGGGIGLITQCDLRVATPSATFSLPEIKVGRAGGASHLRRFVGEGRVRRTMFTGDPISARVAFDWGLVDEIIDERDWPSGPRALAGRIAAHGRDALVFMKRALDESERAGLEHGYTAEQAVTEAMRLEGVASGPASPVDDEAPRSDHGS